MAKKEAADMLAEMGQKDRAYLEKNLTKDVNIKKYTQSVLNY